MFEFKTLSCEHGFWSCGRYIIVFRSGYDICGMVVADSDRWKELRNGWRLDAWYVVGKADDTNNEVTENLNVMNLEIRVELR